MEDETDSTRYYGNTAKHIVKTLLLIVEDVRVLRIRGYSETKPPGLYFSKALFEGRIFGGAYLLGEICVSKSIGLAL